MADIIYGIRPVVEALRGRRRRVFEVLDASNSKEARSAAGGVPVRKIERSRADELARGGVHQGVVARVEPYPYSGLQEILAPSRSPILLLDGVTDPHNLGAVLRVADAVGAGGVVIPKDRAVGVTAAAVKASAGASEHVRVARVTNLKRAVEELKAANVWVYAAEAQGTPYAKLDLAGNVAFVLGSEGRGVRRLVREACDGTISLPMLGAVSSLNVSVAAAVLSYETLRQRG